MKNVSALPHRIIRASAGSGKTYQLTGRYLSLLRRGAMPPTILATTFSRKAAGEILGRVMLRLARASSDQDARATLAADLGLELLKEEDCLAMLKAMVDQLHRLAISTIDSFFNRIAQSFRLELDLPADAQMVDEADPIARQIRAQAIEAMLSSAAESSKKFQTLLGLLQRLHHDAAARRVTAAIDDIVTDFYALYRVAPNRAQWSNLSAQGLLDDAGITSAISALQNMEEDLPQTKAGTPNKTWRKAWQGSIDAANNADWEVFLKDGIVAKLLADELQYARHDISASWGEVYQPLIDHAGAVLIQRLAQQTQATYDLLSQFDRHYTRLRRQFRVMLFNDLTYKLAHELPQLGPDAQSMINELYFRLDAQVMHLLLDEFQDTSLDQWAVLAPLAEEIVAYGDGSRSFFCVGDTKQAIYAWRGGCAELFDHIEQLPGLQDGAAQSLSTSWRSSSIVLDAVNQVFTNIADNPALQDDREAALAWQNGFQTHKAAKKLPGYVRLETSPAPPKNIARDDEENDNDDSRFTAHEEFAAQRIAQLHRQSPALSIGVLVDTNKMLDLMLYELRKMGLRVSGEGGNPLSDEPAVAAVLSAMILADHPGDSAAAFHVLNSPVGPVVGLNNISSRQTQRVAEQIRQSLLTDGYAHTIARWIKQLAPSCCQRSLQKLIQLVELAQQYEPATTLRPGHFVDFIEATHVEQASPASIRVMTINKAKGLEFDIVVLPQLDRQLSNKWDALAVRPQPTADITAVYRYPSQALRHLSEPLQRAYDLQRAQQRRDDLCKLYVALTRAKHGLYMLIKAKQRNKLCPASILRHALGEVDPCPEGGDVLYQRGNENWWQGHEDIPPTAIAASAPPDQPLKVALAKAPHDARRSWIAVSPSSLQSDRILSGAQLLELEDNAALRFGSLIHHWFSLIGFLDDPGPLPDEQTLLAQARNTLGITDDAWLGDALKQFHKMLKRPAIAQALRRAGADELWQERDFVVHSKGQLLRGAFDRVAINRDDHKVPPVTTATLIDFKTDRVDQDNVEDTLSIYRPQLEAYRQALSIMLGIDPQVIAAKLLFVTSGDVVDL